MRILPDGYTQLEYIQSSGTQYIDTKFNPNQNSGIEVKAYFDANKSVYGDYHCMNLTAGSSGGYFYYSPSGGTSAKGNWKNAIHVFKQDKNLCYVDGELHHTFAATTFQQSTSIYLFGRNDGGILGDAGGTVKIYYCKIYDNDTLIRNYIPCKNQNGEIGLYDLVNGMFYGNAGTGAFTAGPEFSYNEVEYIESTGTQYIDTGFKPNQDTRLDIESAAVSSTSGTFYLYGSAESYNKNAFECYDYNTQFEFNYDGQYDFVGTIAADEKNIISHNKNIVSINNVILKTFNYSSFTTPYTLTLFAINRGTDIIAGACKIYSCQIYDNGTLIRNYVPVIGTDGVAGLWDKVEKVFYGNAGTGAFIAGTEFLEEWSDLEYIESTGTQYVNTGFVPNQDTRVVMDYELIGFKEAFGCLFGARRSDNTKSFAFYCGQSGTGFDQYESQYDGTPVTQPAGRQTIDKNKNTTTIAGVYNRTFTYSAFTAECPLCLLVGNELPNPMYFFSGKLYSCQVYDNGTLVRDYVPCLTSDGRVGLRNALNNTFFSNMGSGVFVAGPIIPGILPPLAPEKAAAVYKDFANVLLVWSMSEGAEKYNIMRNGTLIGTTENTFFFDNQLDKETTYSYSISALNEGGESEPVTVLAETTKFKLITDRTADDVQEAIQAINTGTLPEAWFAGLKGAYNAVDFNRVEAAVLFVIERLKTAGWYLAVQSKTDWTFADFPSAKEMQRYLDNVRLLRSALPVNMPAMPDTMRLLKYEEANTIEQILKMLDDAVTNIMLNVYFVNEVYSGEV